MDATRDWRVEQVKRLSTDTDPIAAADVTRGVPAMHARPSRWQLIGQWAGFFAMVTAAGTALFGLLLWAVGVL